MAAQELIDLPVDAPRFESAVEVTFTKDELAQFESDDRTAGSTIAKILSMLFVYTVVAMSIVVWWTFRSVLN